MDPTPACESRAPRESPWLVSDGKAASGALALLSIVALVSMDDCLCSTIANDDEATARIIVPLTGSHHLGPRFWNNRMSALADFFAFDREIDETFTITFGRVSAALAGVRIGDDAAIHLRHTNAAPVSAALRARTTLVI